MLQLINVTFNYIEKLLINDLSLTIQSNNLLHIKGKNGVGKTTLLKLLVGLIHPESGDIRYNNHSIYKNLAAYHQEICYVGHKTGVHQGLTVGEYCSFMLHHKTNINPLLEQMGLHELEHQKCGLLSFGQRRRLSLMRLFISNAKIWFLDEPFIALDENSIKILMHHIQLHINNGGSVVLTSHQALPYNIQQYNYYELT